MATIIEKLEYIRAYSSKEDLYELLAEESSELAAASAKMSRILRGTNPTSVTQIKGYNRVLEEFCDVLNVAEVLYMGDGSFDDAFTQSYRYPKINRWYNRLKRARENKSE